MELIRPSIQYNDSFLRAVHEFEQEGPYGRHLPFPIPAVETDFHRYLQRLSEVERGENLPKDFVPQSDYWLVEGKEYIGKVTIRHRLNEHLRQIGGHIGYEMRPSVRGRGYGTKILGLALPYAKQLGIEKALLTCDETNLPSRKIIERNGGILENTVSNPGGGPDKMRFWIQL